MKLIKSLGKRDDVVNPSTGNMMQTVWYLFECPVCQKQFEQRGKRALKRKTCKACRGTQNVKHGHSGKPYYYVWQAMIQRCNNPKNKKYPIYGGKGIKVYEAWTTFEGFWKDNEQFYKTGLSIDRMDSSKGYNPNNVRWITKANNSSKTTKRRPVIQMRKVLKPEPRFEEVQVWESAKKAANELGLTANAITAVCSDKPQYTKNLTHGGFGWKYK